MSLLEEVASPLNCYPLVMRDEVEEDGLSTPCNGITVSKHDESWFPPGLEAVPCVLHVDSDGVILEHGDQLGPLGGPGFKHSRRKWSSIGVNNFTVYFASIK